MHSLYVQRPEKWKNMCERKYIYYFRMFFCCLTRLSLGVTLHLEFSKAVRGVLRFAKRGQLCPALVVRHLWGRDGWFFNFLEQFGQNMAQFLQMHRKHVLEVRGVNLRKSMTRLWFLDDQILISWLFFPLPFFCRCSAEPLTADLPPIQSVKRRWTKEMTRDLLKLEGFDRVCKAWSLMKLQDPTFRFSYAKFKNDDEEMKSYSNG